MQQCGYSSKNAELDAECIERVLMERGVTSAAAVPRGTSARSIRMHLAVLAKAGACGAEGGAPAAEPPSSSDGTASNGELMMSVLGSMAAGVSKVPASGKATLADSARRKRIAAVANNCRARAAVTELHAVHDQPVRLIDTLKRVQTAEPTVLELLHTSGLTAQPQGISLPGSGFVSAAAVAELVSEVLAVQHMAHVAIAAMLASSSLCPLHMRSSRTRSSRWSRPCGSARWRQHRRPARSSWQTCCAMAPRRGRGWRAAQAASRKPTRPCCCCEHCLRLPRRRC